MITFLPITALFLGNEISGKFSEVGDTIEST